MDLPSDHPSITLYRAPWIVPVTSPIIKNGAVAVQGGRIKAVGLWSDLIDRYSDSDVCHFTGVLMPGLVNAHIHLELSAFGVIPLENDESTMCDWVRNLLKKRMSSTFTEKEIHSAAEKCAQDQFSSGVVALLDTGNTSLAGFTGETPRIYSLLELIGPSDKASKVASVVLENLSDEINPTGHAPYSTSPKLLKNIKKQCVVKKSLFSLHVEENPDEALLLFQGKGCFYEFLQEREALDGTFPLTRGNYRSVIDYLDKTQILDSKTICVHCVYVNEDDIQILAETNSHICLCPSSNKFLGFPVAPLKEFLAHSILPALGTDSIASNPHMSLWYEMAQIRKEFPEIAAETILAMATIAGAKALGQENDFGSLEPGKVAGFIVVEDQKISTVASEKELLDILTSIEKPEKVTHCN